jgi:hypothetical protein
MLRGSGLGWKRKHGQLKYVDHEGNQSGGNKPAGILVLLNGGRHIIPVGG